jgi:hypothetical protein
MRKKGGAGTVAMLSFVIAFVISLAVAPLGFSANADATRSPASVCAKCCQPAGCCAVKQESAPAAPQPISAASSQQIECGLAVSGLPLLFQFPQEKADLRFSDVEFPHCSTTPLAQGCIALI